MKKSKVKATKKPMNIYHLAPKDHISWCMDFHMVPTEMIVAADCVPAARKIAGWAWIDASLSTCKKLDPTKYKKPSVILEG